MDFQLEYTVEVPATIEYKVRAFSRESAMHIVLSTCPSDLVSEECITQEGYDNMSVDGYKLPLSDEEQQKCDDDYNDEIDMHDFNDLEEAFGYDRAIELSRR